MRFSLKDSLQLLEDDIKMIVKCVGKIDRPNLLIVLGDTGTSKTETIRNILIENKTDYAYLRGDIKSPSDMYKLLYKNNGRLIVIDDSNLIVKKNSKFMSYLLAITDRGANKRITCLNNFDPDIQSSNNLNGKYPQNFIFTGSIICISNLKLTKLDDAFKSRAIINIIETTNEDIIIEVERKLDLYYVEIPMIVKKISLDFLKKVTENVKRYKIDFRTYQKVIEYFNLYEKEKAEAIIYKKIEQGII